MKKVKIMLLSLLVLAVAGGAMAFKTRFLSNYCVTLAQQDINGNFFCNPNPPSCRLSISVTTTIDITLIPLCTTAKPVTGCTGVTSCTIKSSLKKDF